MMKIVITGARGLLGWHAAVRLHAVNAGAEFAGEPAPYDIVTLDRAEFNDPATLEESITDADAVLHFAGVNRAPDEVLENANPDIATQLAQACQRVNTTPHIVYANSTHASSDTVYGRSKQKAGEILAASTGRYSDLILPHIFGEGARPFYNNVAGTLIEQILAGEDVTVNPGGQVHLVHAGAATQIAIDAVLNGTCGVLRPEGRQVSVPDLYAKLSAFHESYRIKNIFPELRDPFDLALFNSYRAASYPQGWPIPLKLNSDDRGTLFEAVKCDGGQVFLSTTNPGVTRGDHFHLHKVERFLVLQGEACIRIRKVLYKDAWAFNVSGDAPAVVDMPTLHTHSIENIGKDPLITLFWTHDLFDPLNPDTYRDSVLT
jgi:UDP-2-acetamido-2,6-beta-L-arabino-hexul-4-ose reductase